MYVSLKMPGHLIRRFASAIYARFLRNESQDDRRYDLDPDPSLSPALDGLRHSFPEPIQRGLASNSIGKDRRDSRWPVGGPTPAERAG